MYMIPAGIRTRIRICWPTLPLESSTVYIEDRRRRLHYMVVNVGWRAIMQDTLALMEKLDETMCLHDIFTYPVCLKIIQYCLMSDDIM